MSDGKYFTTTKKGEIHELKEELRSLDRPKKKDAVKKVIAAMTVGKDVSMLFPDVVNCMQTEDLELKKLVYLYLINYAKSQPDLAIMAVNTFVKDSADPNPLIRALAVRTMGCIRVDKITEYLCDPLQRCLEDKDPYVRKTAAICVSKLYDINPELVEDRGFVDMLRNMLSDENPMVVANALAALQELQDISGKDVMQLTSTTLFKLLAALNECTEWGQVFILDSITTFDTKDPKDAERIVERVLPRLQHVNSAVVLSAVKVIMKQMEIIGNDDLIKAWCKKMAPPLARLLSAEPEVQYVALRNINLIVQKRPFILANEVQVFFCKYNDPIYVKMEKLEIMIKLANEKNIDQVLLEFKEYAQEVDVDFVRKAVRAIGRCAISIEKAAERCINVLLELIQTKVNYVVQEAIIVIKDIFRRYPNQYESIIATLCENLDTLDEPEAKASIIWIIGEYAERIDNADELLESFLESFPEETAAVQLQLLTATVKLFLKKPTEAAQKISAVLSCATNETDNPDLRDRAYIYWRLLSTDPEAAKAVVLAEKPVIMDDSAALDPPLLDLLLSQLATLASVYHRPPETFVSRLRLAVQKVELDGHKFEEEEGAGGAALITSDGSAAHTGGQAAGQLVDLLDLDLDTPPAPAAAPVPIMVGGMPAMAPAPVPAPASGLDDLLGGFMNLSMPAATPVAQPVLVTPVQVLQQPVDPFAMFMTPAVAAPMAQPSSLPVLVTPDKGHGLTVSGHLTRVNGQIIYHMSFHNGSPSPVDGLMIQTNKSSCGISPTNQVVPVSTLMPGATANASIPMHVDATKIAPGPYSPQLQLALKTGQLGVIYFYDNVPLPVLLEETGEIDGQNFLMSWRALPPEVKQQLPCTIGNAELAKQKLLASRLFVLAHRAVPNTTQEALYVTGRVAGVGAQILLELRFTASTPGVEAYFKSANADIATAIFSSLSQILS